MRKLTRTAFLALAALALPACLSLGGEGPPKIRRHSIDLPEIIVAAEEPIFGPIIVKEFASRGRYEPRVLVTDGPGQVEYLELDRWVEEPSDAVTTVIRELLASSGKFEAVAASTSEMQTDQVLDGSLIACDVVRDGAGPWRVRFAVRLEATQRSTGEMIVARAYEAERTLPGAGTEGLGAAMGDCVADVVQQALADWTYKHEIDPITRAE
jgi:ABC-type uncharacterized transport system auxiliary subunit